MMGPAIVPSDKRASSKVFESPRISADNNDGVGVKMNQILPTGPTVKELKLESTRITKHNFTGSRSLSFGEAFGILGVPILLVLVVCVAWTAALLFLALSPNKAANLLMNTGDYDKGGFWLIKDENPHLRLIGAFGLGVVGIFYVFVMCRMLLWRKSLFKSSSRARTTSKSYRWLGSIGPSYKRSILLWNELTSFEGKNRKRWNTYLKLIDLSMETMMLRQLLANGSPTSLTYNFVGFLVVNALSCAANVMTDRFSALTEVFIDSIFDFCAAVLFPIATLIYSYYNFDFDRDVYLTYLEKLPPGSFERFARSFADPARIALFQVNFDSLRIKSLLDFVLRISMNLAFCYRFMRVLMAFVWNRHREHTSIEMKGTARVSSTQTEQNPVPKVLTAVLVAFSLIVLLFTNKAVSDSTAACAAYPECVVYVHQWGDTDGHCPCLILIDIDLAPKTYGEWTNPPDAFDKVKVLAASGMLRSLQVINRQLLQWPEELRSCQKLKAIQLFYTNTQTVPVWVKDLRHLETMYAYKYFNHCLVGSPNVTLRLRSQIEGKYGDQNLLSLPEDLFSDLPRLSFLQLGIHDNLERIPPLYGVPHLQSLILAWVPLLPDIPSLDRVPELKRLNLVLIPRLKQIPDMSPLQNLVEFVMYGPSRVCCNGFVGGCDLNHSSCRANSFFHTHAATCLKNDADPHLPVVPFLGNTATEKVFERFATTICQESPFDRAKLSVFPTKETIEVCEGKPYRECHFPGNITGICFNTRFEVLSCISDDNYITLRRFQIQQGVGPKCDVIEEKWLGCGE